MMGVKGSWQTHEGIHREVNQRGEKGGIGRKGHKTGMSPAKHHQPVSCLPQPWPGQHSLSSLTSKSLLQVSQGNLSPCPFCVSLQILSASYRGTGVSRLGASCWSQTMVQEPHVSGTTPGSLGSQPQLLEPTATLHSAVLLHNRCPWVRGMSSGSQAGGIPATMYNILQLSLPLKSLGISLSSLVHILCSNSWYLLPTFYLTHLYSSIMLPEKKQMQ